MRKIGAKYQTSGDLTKLDGTPIPDDEPLMLFRAKDTLLPKLLEQYHELCKEAGSPEEHLSDLQEQIDLIRDWQAAHSATTPD